ncbi:hypothetical protein [Kitasatospora sp. NPDC018619]|uniref:hypothetical protein n=1 Tax=unclassified Kitasatospora TaxID=2633591 RepID=UPI0037AA1D58
MRADHEVLVEIPGHRPPAVRTLDDEPVAVPTLAAEPVAVLEAGSHEIRVSWANPG